MWMLDCQWKRSYIGIIGTHLFCCRDSSMWNVIMRQKRMFLQNYVHSDGISPEGQLREFGSCEMGGLAVISIYMFRF